MTRIRFGPIVLMLLIVATAAFAQRSSPKNGDKLITDLTKTDRIAGVFGDDGVMIHVFEPEVRRIVKLGKRAIPLLIAHLDDRRPMPFLVFNAPGDKQTVRVRDFCFDMLLKIIVHNASLFDQQCEKEEYRDAFGECLRPYFDGPNRKRRWQTAFKKGKVRYDPRNILITDEN